MLLRRANVASIFESDPRMACFKQHGEHLAPQVVGLDGAAGLDVAGSGFLFVGHIGLFKRNAKFVVQIGAVGG